MFARRFTCTLCNLQDDRSYFFIKEDGNVVCNLCARLSLLIQLELFE